MNGSINRRELLLKALAGLAGGAIGWLPVELASHGHSLTEQISTAGVVASYAAMALFSGLIGGLILAVERQQLEISPATQRRFWTGFLICLVLAVPADYFANSVFSSILHFGGWELNHEGSTFYLFCARVVSWIIMGAMLGAGVGLSTFSPPNILKGAVGGWVGGFIGGILFDPINYATGGGLVSRLIGLSSIGLAIGLFIGLVQELTKAAWITVDQGRLRGRQFRIEGARATMGRAEENPIGLFGDQAVQQRHAVIERSGSDYVIRNLAVQEGTFVNGARIETAALHEGDQIRIGGYLLSFHLRQASGAGVIAPRISGDGAGREAQAVVSVGPCLIDGAGHQFPVRTGATTRLGRALDNDIVVAHSSVSRHHASIEAVNGGFELHDLQSQNGTFVGDERVTQKRIVNGDPIKLGQAPFTFRA